MRLGSLARHLVLAATLTLSLVACGDDDGGQNDNQNNANGNANGNQNNQNNTNQNNNNASLCGNDVRDTGEACDGTDLGTATCQTAGRDGGTLTCSAACALVTTGCCDDGCTAAGHERCSTATQLQTCVLQASGCLAWEDTESCSPGSCEEDGDTATCVAGCTSDCSTAGATRCVNDTLQTCQTSGTCLVWTQTEVCAGYCGGSPAACLTSGSGQTCDDVYNLTGRPHPTIVPGQFFDGPAIDPSCGDSYSWNTLYATYTIQAAQPGAVLVQAKDRGQSWAEPLIAAFVTTDPTSLCDAEHATELGCVSPGEMTALLELDAADAGLTDGSVIWLEVVSYYDDYGNIYDYPLLDPAVDVFVADCAVAPTATLVEPGTATGADPRTRIVVEFENDVPDLGDGTVILSVNATPVATYALADDPAAIRWDLNRMILTPELHFPLGSTVSLALDLVGRCGDPITGTLSFTVAGTAPHSGEDCTDPIPLAVGTHAIGPYDATNVDVMDAISSACSYSGEQDALFSITMGAGMNGLVVEIDKSAQHYLTAMLLGSCSTSATELACMNDDTRSDFILDANGLTPGATYYLAIGNFSEPLPDPEMTTVTVFQYQHPSLPLPHDGVGVALVSEDGVTWSTLQAGSPLLDVYYDNYELIAPGSSAYRVIRVAGATGIAIQGTFDTEEWYDDLRVQDATGRTYLSRNGTGSFHVWVPGDTAIIGMVSDYSSTGDYTITGVTYAN